jgi:hypothetical protein
MGLTETFKQKCIIFQFFITFVDVAKAFHYLHCKYDTLKTVSFVVGRWKVEKRPL